MQAPKLLIANRGEIAIRIAQAAYDLGIPSVSIYSEDDSTSLHIQKTDEAYPLNGSGPKAYLDMLQILAIAQEADCTLVHPGYGFLSENADFAEVCEKQGISFIGPRPEVLRMLGDKSQARKLAREQGIPILPGTEQRSSLAEAEQFFQSLPEGSSLLIKALSGGGGRGMGLVNEQAELASTFERCQMEAEKAFGEKGLYVEQYLPLARHMEVQIIGDGKEVAHVWERECSLQRQHQKLVEIAPCQGMAPELRERILRAALKMAQSIQYEGAGTFEFLVSGSEFSKDASFYFLEANPRIQVEHTVTEEVTGIDLVAFQIQQALGATLVDLGLRQADIPRPKGFAIQARMNMESMDSSGRVLPKTGQLTQFEMPFGKGVRVETLGYKGFANSPAFDTLLAKLIVHHPSGDWAAALKKLYRKLCECHIVGIETNVSFLQNLLIHPAVEAHSFHTRWVEENLRALLEDKIDHPQLFRKDSSLQDLEPHATPQVPEGLIAIRAAMPGSILQIFVQQGEEIKRGQNLILMEAMKMESLQEAEVNGIVREIWVKEGEVIREKQVLLLIQELGEGLDVEKSEGDLDLDYIRPELAELQQRKAFLLDEQRPEAVAKRRKKGKQTARENVAQLCDEESFIEYGSLIVAAQRNRRSEEDLIRNTPADGIITGIGEVNGTLFGPEVAKCMILCYDYTVLAGTQGTFGHHKTDRVLEVARKSELPLILFAEGGGGRPGDIDTQAVAGLHIKTFSAFAQHNGIAPRVAIVSGYCFAGNAALAGCADVIIATEDTSIGMGGPAMIEGGGLGKFHPKEVGPVEVQSANGVLDMVVKDEVEAIEKAKKYLSYFQGDIQEWKCEDQRVLRHLIPENRRRIYDIRTVITSLADNESVMELRREYAQGMITAFIRIEGKPMGLLANNPIHLGGAIDAEGAGKAARFVQLCDVFGIPILSLCDTPGFMVGPEAEKTGLVRHTSRLFTAMAKKTVPIFTIILRKAYGLGAMAMAGGGMHETLFSVAWPTGEFGAMGLEGAVRLGYRKELEAVEDPKEREALFQKMVAQAYQHGKAINTATYLEIDEVIDPVDTRKWIINGLLSTPKAHKSGKGYVDTF